MIARTLYSLFYSIKFRKTLLRVLKYGSIHSVLQISNSMPNSVLALDFDGVLAPHGYPRPVDEITFWLKELITSGRYKRVYIYSNKPTDARKIFFAELSPEIRFVSNQRKKPYPDGLRFIAEQEGVAPTNIIMVDDRLLTGILAAIIAGTSWLYISRPLKDYGFNTVPEIFFTILRFSEVQIIRVLGII
jgi:putative phosphatase